MGGMTAFAAPLRVGVSSCLLGRPVRYNGGHKRDDFVVDVLGPRVTFVPVCPEVELGLGTPRETLRLVRRGEDVRMIMATGEDHTNAMRGYSARRVAALVREDLDGYILKKDSPSCGMAKVKVYDRHGSPSRGGRGLFAAALIDAMPMLPIEEEGRLSDANLRENFVARLFAFRRLKTLFAGRWTVGDLVRFHTAHKLTLLAHSTTAYSTLGRRVAAAKNTPRAELRDAYMAEFMKALTLIATPKKHANVLQHMVGHFRGRLDDASRDELLALIDEYRRERVPLIAPLTLIRHHVRRLGVDYLAGQTYLAPSSQLLD